MNDRTTLKFSRFVEYVFWGSQYVYCRVLDDSVFEAVYKDFVKFDLWVNNEKLKVIERKNVKHCNFCKESAEYCELLVNSNGEATIEEIICPKCAMDIMKDCGYDESS